MRRKIRRRLKDQSGAALIFVILALVIVSIFAVGVASLVSRNLIQAKAQENDMKAYYLSLSGSDLCFAALLQQGPLGENDTLLYEEFSEHAHANALHAPTLTDTLELEDGDVELTVRAFDDEEGERWVEIRSTGTLDDSSATKTTVLQFMVSNPLVQMKYNGNETDGG